MSINENTFTAKVMAYLNARGGHWSKISPSPWGKNGVADILGCYRGRYIAIELKKPGKYKVPRQGCSAAQLYFLRQIDLAGGITLVTDSMEALEEWRETLDSEIGKADMERSARDAVLPAIRQEPRINLAGTLGRKSEPSRKPGPTTKESSDSTPKAKSTTTD